MKLAEALQERADLKRTLNNLKERLQRVTLVQEGEKPAEDPQELLRIQNACFQRMEYLIAAINHSNDVIRVNGLTLGDDEARTMGVHAGRVRLAVILCATLITAASVAVSGMIGWVGLVIPHLSRKLVGNDYRRLTPASMLFGAAFMLAVDNVSRNLLATEIPIGILTAFVGAPFFIWLITRKGDAF